MVPRALGGPGARPGGMMMAADQAVDAPREMCQAQPEAARHGWRDDALCANGAHATVRFRRRDVPVCRMHHKTYAHWGDDAEANAQRFWGWPRK